MRITAMLMTLAFRSSSTVSVTAFQFVRHSSKQASSRLRASFLDDLSKAFSSMTTPSGTDSAFYTVGITGASGLVGSALRDELGKRETVNGKPVRIIQLARGDAPGKLTDEATSLVWNPKGDTAESILDPSAVSEMDAIVHLAGENVATGLGPLGFLGIRPWTKEKKAEIVISRVGPTKALAKVLASCKGKSFLVASGVGVYGDQFIGESAAAVDETADTTSSPGFLAQVSRDWEAATEEAKNGNRVVNMRFGVAMSTKGGALAKLYPIFFLGGGGNVGSGDQYFSYISARDLARAIVHTLETPSLSGPVNMCAPNACTNAEFTKALGKVVNRPTLLPFPGFAVSLLFGEMGEEMLLGGVRAEPGKLLNSGFEFLHDTVEKALQNAVDDKSI